jgi:uncharacterized C2H2 Zn-finger protein
MPSHRQDGVPATGRPRLDCPQCGFFFRRQEHLKRHLDRHRGVRPFVCPACDKSFARRDTLKRHVSTHGSAAMAALRQERETTAPLAACQACARSKQRCRRRGNGNEACESCQRKGRECVYARSGVDDPYSASPPLSPVDDLESAGPAPMIHSGGTWEASATAQAELTSNLSLTASVDVPAIINDLDAHLHAPSMSFAWDAMFLEPNGLTFSLFPSPTHDWLADDGQTNEITCATHELSIAGGEDEDALISEHVPHVPSVPVETHEKIISFAREHLAHRAGHLPSKAHLDVYVQLYFEYFHPRMPFLHVPTFDVGPDSWYLVLCAAAIGSQYSTASQSPKHLDVFRELAKQITQRDVSANHGRYTHFGLCSNLRRARRQSNSAMVIHLLPPKAY